MVAAVEPATANYLSPPSPFIRFYSMLLSFRCPRYIMRALTVVSVFRINNDYYGITLVGAYEEVIFLLFGDLLHDPAAK